MLTGIPINSLTMTRVNSSLTGVLTDVNITLVPPAGGVSAGGYFVIDLPNYLF